MTQERNTLQLPERRSLLAAFWSAIGSYGNVFISFLVFLILARLLAPDEFGIVAIATVFIDIILVVARGGLPEAIIQRPDLEEEYADTAFWLSTVSGTVLCLALMLAAPFLASLFGMAELEPVLMALSAVLFIIGAGAIHEARLQRAFAFRKLAMRALFSNLVAGAVAVLLAFQGWGVWAMVAQRLIASLVTTAMNWIAAGWLPHFRFVGAFARDQWNFGSRLFTANLLLGVNIRLQELIAAFFLTPAAVGYIRLSWRCIDLVSQIAVIPFGSVAMATYSRVHEENGQLEGAYFGFIRLSGSVAFPCFLGMAAIAPVLVPVAFGDNWVPAVPVLQLLCMTALPFVANSFMWPLMAAIKRADRNLQMSFIQFLGGSILCLLAAPFGLIAVTLAHVIRAYIIWPLALMIMQKDAGISIKGTFSTIVIPFALSAIMALLVGGAYALLQGSLSPVPTLITLVAGGMLAYTALLFLFMPNDVRTLLAEASRAFKKR